MRLTALQIRRLPGIVGQFSVEPAAEPSVINVVTGPNASGKTSLLRAMLGLLYDGEYSSAEDRVEATFVDDAGRMLESINNGGQTVWYDTGERVEPPALPPERFASCFLLRFEDLGGPKSATEDELAGHIRRQLMGGYDLKPLHERFRWHPAAARTATKSLDDAIGRRDEAARSVTALHAEEEHLEELNRELGQAKADAAALDRIDRAMEYLQAYQERERLDAQIAELPDNMRLITGEEIKQLERIDGELEGARVNYEEAQECLKKAQARLDETGLKDSQLDQGSIDEARETLRELEHSERDLTAARDSLREADERLASHREVLGSEPESDPGPINHDTVRRASVALDDRRTLDAQIRELEAQRDRLPAEEDLETPSPLTLQEGRDALVAWLAAAGERDRTAGRWLDWLLLGIPLLAAVIAAALAVHPAFFALLLSGLGIAFAWYRLDPGRPMRRARARFEATNLSPPEVWTRRVVEAAVRTLEEEIASAAWHERRVQARQEAEQALEAKCKRWREADEAVAAVASELGFDPRKLDEGLVAWLDAVQRYREQRATRAAAAAEVERLATTVTQRRQELVEFLALYGAAPAESVPDHRTLGKALDALGQRVGKRDKALEAIGQAMDAMTKGEERIESLAKERTELFTSRELADGAEQALRHVVDSRDTWVELTNKRHQAVGRENSACAGFDSEDDSELIALAQSGEAQQLEQRRDEAQRRAEKAESLRNRIADIEARIKQAKERRDLASREGEVQAARDALARKRAEGLHKRAGAFLIEEVQGQAEAEQRPPALAQAQAWFEAFTHRRFALVMHAGDPPRFGARDLLTGRQHALTELSTGTRMQLLLAVRLGFAIYAEGELGRMPLFLDHALATTDPGRFRDVAQAIHQIATDQERQVFYLTADPAEHARWVAAIGEAAVNEIDVAKARQIAAAVDDPGALLAEPRATLPDPASVGADAFLEAVEVPPVDPWSPPDLLHLFYVLGDRLERLAYFLGRDITHVGQLRALLDNCVLDDALDAGEREWLQARIAGVTAWIEGWREGRGWPIDRTVLVAAELDDSRQFEDIVAETEAVAGDPEAVLERLKRIRNLRKKRIDVLETYLRDHGYMPIGTRLTPEQLQQRVLEAFAGRLDAEAAGPEAQALSERVMRGVEVTPSTAATG